MARRRRAGPRTKAFKGATNPAYAKLGCGPHEMGETNGRVQYERSISQREGARAAGAGAACRGAGAARRELAGKEKIWPRAARKEQRGACGHGGVGWMVGVVAGAPPMKTQSWQQGRERGRRLVGSGRAAMGMKLTEHGEEKEYIPSAGGRPGHRRERHTAARDGPRG
jgi:hypothetical protein